MSGLGACTRLSLKDRLTHSFRLVVVKSASNFELHESHRSREGHYASYELKKDARYCRKTVALRRDVDGMSWNDFVVKLNTKFFNMRTINANQRDFNKLKQRSMHVTEAVTKFKQLARLCPHLASIGEERVRRMIKMFKPKLGMAIDSGNQAPVIMTDCVEHALRVESSTALPK